MNQQKTFTIVDVPTGTIIHTENFKSAFAILLEIGYGYIYRYDDPNLKPTIRKARETWDKGQDNE